jgi:hypothetical protein
MDRARTRHTLCAALAAAAALAATSVVRAELLRCTGPDGKVIYTDKKSVCPDAQPFQPTAVLQGIEPQDPSAATERKSRAALREQQADDQAGEEQRWRELRRAKEDELREVRAEHDHLAGFVAWCNHGGALTVRDDSGMKSSVRCEELRDRMATLTARQAALEDYLERQLPDECRRAGCLPGWIR